MNWQSDIVTPHTNSNANNKNLSLLTSTSPQTTTQTQNTNYLSSNISNYNRILAGSPSLQRLSPKQTHSPVNNSLIVNSYSSSSSPSSDFSGNSNSNSNIYPNLTLPSFNLNDSYNKAQSFIYQQQPHQQTLMHQSNSSQSLNSKALVAQIIDLIKSLNIKLIAFDFDCTIVTIHTGGQWIDSPDKLAEFVRPCFRELLPALLQCPDFYVCVVTYSPQEQLIREVLRISMKDEHLV